MKRLASIPSIPPDAAFSLVAAFEADTNEQKVDLCPGFYRDNDAKPWILPSVSQAKQRIHANKDINHEHLPLTGHAELLRGSRNLIFGTRRDLSRIASMQTVSGTGANHIAAQFLSTKLWPKTVWISNPSWINYTEIWRLADPNIQQRFYPYFDKESQGVDFDGMVETLRKEASSGDAVVLQACAHNPTGVDLTEQQWDVIATICKEVGLFVVFDLAYQGFATGDVARDAFAITHFYDKFDLEFAIAQSFSKNFGLYGERVGVVHIVTLSPETATNITPLLTQISRAEITSCPSYGARIIAEILGDQKLYTQWLKDLITMSERMKIMRRKLYEGLQRRGVQGAWQHLLSDIGMFSMTGLSPSQVVELREKYHIYLLPSGRLSVTGLTSSNVENVAEAFHAVVGSKVIP